MIADCPSFIFCPVTHQLVLRGPKYPVHGSIAGGALEVPGSMPRCQVAAQWCCPSRYWKFLDLPRSAFSGILDPTGAGLEPDWNITNLISDKFIWKIWKQESCGFMGPHDKNQYLSLNKECCYELGTPICAFFVYTEPI